LELRDHQKGIMVMATNQITTLVPDQAYSVGSFLAFVAPFNAGSYVYGQDYTANIAVTNGSLTSNVAMSWNWGSTPCPDGVYDFSAIDYGYYDNTVVNTPIPSATISSIQTLTETHSLTFAGNLQGFDAIDDMFLTTSPENSNTNVAEIEVFLHTPTYSAQYVQASTPIGTFQNSGITWTVAESVSSGSTQPDFLIMPTNQADVPSGTIDLKAALNYLVSKGLIAGSLYFNGFALGTETQSGSGSMTINSLSVAYSTTTSSSPPPPPPPPPPSTPSPSPNDSVVLAGATGSLTDASGNTWTIVAGVVDENGAAAGYSANVAEIAYVNATIWQENTSSSWWSWNGTAWSGPGTTTSPLPAAPPIVTASPNDTMVLAGSTAAITDASGNAWTITASGQVAVNGIADTTTANVTELAYVNKQVWQENASNLWWGKTAPTAAWAPGTSTSPLPAPVTIASGTTSSTVSQSEVSIVATAGTHILFLKGSGDIVNLSGGAETITDTGGGNTFILPAAGKGTDSFTCNILAIGDTLDLKPALAATNWNGSASTLSKYLTVTDTTAGATLSIAKTSGGAGVLIGSISGNTTASLTSLLAHSIT
jgi:hypothetical protein